MPRSAQKGKPSYRLLVRFPVELGDRLKEAARYYHRSINSEIVARVEHTFTGLTPAVVDADSPRLLSGEIETILRDDLSVEEDRLVRGFRRLSDRQRRALLDLVSDISEDYGDSESV